MFFATNTIIKNTLSMKIRLPLSDSRLLLYLSAEKRRQTNSLVSDCHLFPGLCLDLFQHLGPHHPGIDPTPDLVPARYLP